ncbi:MULTISPECIES: response regulator [unclassified Tolypothrix]|uniref:response regulator n=1 Tax=unclassified Tolypothrix TaxID=2649714 RepID=UPI0005EAC3A6|nr:MULTISPECIES: response regulator [unclassified Tolypothrix]BAY94864.1 response regulator receiver domain protein [Microchaete diplosiphon NIES-3275]EKF00902.1 response regulator [Tolypothrix sp. PCC 7601]MBE9087579.1 response regulator [Tolypothrix sp. LEGE 11397]UYD28510.1 response regulator [Tolypothrix sp. PCC 7712]UYD35577.1 response regulator [Tolypothrix sp. PCC 7601]
MTKQVLIVDDDEHLRELVQACLEDLGGWKTMTAPSGKEALKIAQTAPIDAILLDVSMPDMDGFAVFEKLQENMVSQSIPVILLTARVLPRDRDRFALMGIAGVISKPFEPITISQQVADILGWD